MKLKPIKKAKNVMFLQLKPNLNINKQTRLSSNFYKLILT